jgi:hypothetical protein
LGGCGRSGAKAVCSSRSDGGWQADQDSGFPAAAIGAHRVSPRSSRHADCAIDQIYPHFLETDRWTAYTYAAPLGLIPCPTLAAVIGLTMIRGPFASKPWSLTLAAAGLIYGAIGVVRLGVRLDIALLVGAAIIASAAALPHSPSRQRIGPSARVVRARPA